mmetsp:Transcript_22379/g.48682  ORF Transcript_22379/g.48682 Transcript_22379/m.48682 type:complete len:152 (-) Transcript_22379:3566-4021(-)
MGMTAVIHAEQMVANTCCASRGRCVMLISSLLLLVVAAIATTTMITTCNAFVPAPSSSRSIDGTRTSVHRVCRDMDIIEFSTMPILLEQQQQQQQQQEESNTINSSSSSSSSNDRGNRNDPGSEHLFASRKQRSRKTSFVASTNSWPKPPT